MDSVWWPALRSVRTCRIVCIGNVSTTAAARRPYYCCLASRAACSAVRRSRSRPLDTRDVLALANLSGNTASENKAEKRYAILLSVYVMQLAKLGIAYLASPSEANTIRNYTEKVEEIFRRKKWHSPTVVIGCTSLIFSTMFPDCCRIGDCSDWRIPDWCPCIISFSTLFVYHFCSSITIYELAVALF